MTFTSTIPPSMEGTSQSTRSSRLGTRGKRRRSWAERFFPFGRKPGLRSFCFSATRWTLLRPRSNSIATCSIRSCRNRSKFISSSRRRNARTASSPAKTKEAEKFFATRSHWPKKRRPSRRRPSPASVTFCLTNTKSTRRTGNPTSRTNGPNSRRISTPSGKSRTPAPTS